MKQIPGQMSLFDLFDDYPDINSTPEAEAVCIVGDALGLTFAWDKRLEVWIAKRGGTKLNLKYGRFIVGDKRMFFGAGYDTKINGECAGGSSPCRDIADAISYLRRKLEMGER